MAQSVMREIRLVSHSDVVFWWPAWVVGFLTAVTSYFDGNLQDAADGGVGYVHPSNNPGLLFIAVLLLLIVFTNAKLRGIYSVVTLITIAFFTVLFAWFGWWDDILNTLPNLSARANMGFYLIFSTALLIIWLLSFAVFDRLTYWSVRPGQIVEIRLVGGGEHSYDTSGLVFERMDQDFFRHIVLGLGAGDLLLTTSGARKETIRISNVLFVGSRLRSIQQLLAVKLDQLPLQTLAETTPQST